MNARASPVVGFGVAVAAYVLAWVVTYLLWDRLFRVVPFSLFCASVAVTAWIGGLLPGLTVTVAGVLTCFVLLSQQGTAAMVAPSLVLLGLGALISYLSEQNIRWPVERKLLETAGQENLERLSLALSASGMGDWNWDPKTDAVHLSPRAAELFGVPPGPGATWTQLRSMLHPDDVERARLAVEKSITERTEYDIEYRVTRPGQPLRWIAARGRAQFDETGALTGMVGIVQDVTARKADQETRLQQELELRLSDLRFRKLIEQSPLSTQVYSPDGRIVSSNAAWERLFGVTLADVADYNILRDPQLVEHGVMPLIERGFAGEPVMIPPIAYTPDRGQYEGQVRWCGAVIYPVKDDGGTIRDIILVHEDVSERKAAEEELRESEERLRLGMAAGNMGTWDWDIVRNRVAWSEQVYEFHGVNPGEFGGTVEEFGGLVHPDDAERVRGAIDKSLREDVPYEIEFRVIQRNGGQVRWLTTTGRVFRDASGNPVRMMGATRDITDRKLAESERDRLLESERHARAEAERASRIKDEFLAVVSHELRTPLNAIFGYAQLLRMGPQSPEETSQGLEVIERNARMQGQIIEDLLDMSRIVSGKIRLDVRRVDLPPVIDAAIETVRAAADAKGIGILPTLDPHAGPVSGDPGRLQQVVWNLLSNAIKFTPKGGRVRVLLQRVNSHVEILVSDNGAGIRPDFLPHVFERFRQAESPTTRRHGGLGLGLSIARSLVEAHGGTVRVESEGEGRGATFAVTLPLSPVRATPEDDDRVHPTAVSGAGPSKDGPSLNGVRVLVVDDEPDGRALVRRILEGCGAEVLAAGSAREALELLDGQRVDVLLSDIGMPDEDGHTLLRKLRARGTADGAQVPAAALTAFARTEDRTRALLAGFQTHLAKPVEARELIATVASLAGRT